MRYKLLNSSQIITPDDISPEPLGAFEVDTVDSFCSAMKIGRTAFYKDVDAGLIRIIKRGQRTLVPPGERPAYLCRLAARTKPAA